MGQMIFFLVNTSLNGMFRLVLIHSIKIGQFSGTKWILSIEAGHLYFYVVSAFVIENNKSEMNIPGINILCMDSLKKQLRFMSSRKYNYKAAELIVKDFIKPI